jgi:hypothetical protein
MDQEMNGAPDADSDNDSDDGQAMYHTSAVTQSPIFPLAAPAQQNAASPTSQICASDLVNNPYMPDTIKSTPRAVYLAETGNQFINSACSPTVSNDNSGIEETYQHIIYEREFLGHDNATALVSYQLRGSEAATAAGVSRQYRKYVGRWFAHYNLVAPWDVRTNAEKKRLN